MRLKTVFLLLPSILWLLSSTSAQAQTNADPAASPDAPELSDSDQEARELLELRGRLRDIESMLLAQKDRENELLRDLNRMIMASQEEPEVDPVEEAKKEIGAVEERFEEESAALVGKIQQLEVALAAGQERDLQMGQEMNKTILVTVSTVAGIGLLVFLVTVYLQYRLISRPIQPVYMPPQSLAIETEQDQVPTSTEAATPHSDTGLVENTKVQDTNEKFVSAVEQLEERIRHMEAGLSRADDTLNSVESGPEAEEDTEEPLTSESPEEVVNESEGDLPPLHEEPVVVEEALVDEFSREPDEMDVAVLEEEGKRYLQKEDWETALKYFDQLVDLDGARVDNWVNRGRALEMLHREEDAIESYDRAIEANEDLPSPLLYKAALLSRLERFEEAQKFYNAALSKVPVQKTEQATVVG